MAPLFIYTLRQNLFLELQNDIFKCQPNISTNRYFLLTISKSLTDHIKIPSFPFSKHAATRISLSHLMINQVFQLLNQQTWIHL